MKYILVRPTAERLSVLFCHPIYICKTVHDMKNVTIFEKRELMLKEDGITASVAPNGTADLASDISDALKNPNVDGAEIDADRLDNNQANNPVGLEVKASNGTEAVEKIQGMMTNPSVQNLVNTTDTNFVVSPSDGAKSRMMTMEERMMNSVVLTKRELNEMLRGL